MNYMCCFIIAITEHSAMCIHYAHSAGEPITRINGSSNAAPSELGRRRQQKYVAALCIA